MRKQTRLKSPVLWAAAAALLMLVLKSLGYEDAMTQGGMMADAVWSALCAILTALGIVNNPTDPDNI